MILNFLPIVQIGGSIVLPLMGVLRTYLSYVDLKEKKISRRNFTKNTSIDVGFVGITLLFVWALPVFIEMLA